ncbi:MAG: cyclase [Candidatus Omnitrophica bacterium CG08_land_8_20_14_0_20_41_16]|uniref:Cyclase n=1 Tax=Candidatus Sherwoodlollariibacterium unditelluris TaxID=1974757 RepID=A0A2G9YKD2_9BACT|nr:MAG: cyclase [Candidatus Omnitrophica bacterium CG23_combo_of_CG06-09_8_20_14_all_41_10]PIS34111.1 MAG: cyclase [Candidatus Omnitrophica bacterium CG08_land_8_20_14_0_20_41_16]
MRIIDLSLPIDEKAFEVHKVDIERVTHKAGIDKFNRIIMGKTLSGKLSYLLGKRILRPCDVPDGEFLSLEIVHSPVHVGTHLDYSFHYGSKSEGRAAKTADEIPLEYCYQYGVRLDLRHKKPAEAITAADMEAALKRINYNLKPLDIVLLWTGADKFYGRPEYFTDYPGVDTSAIDYLLDCGIKVFGTDTMGIDRPYKFMLKEFLDSKDPRKFYPAHFYGRKREFIHIERLGRLENLPAAAGFKIICFPVRIRQTGAAWSRVVALLD